MSMKSSRNGANSSKAAPSVPKRAARACVACRRVKEKCMGGDPCRRCVRLNRECEFANTSLGEAESGRRNESCLAQENERLARRLAYMEKILIKRLGITNLDTDSLRVLAEAYDENEKDGQIPQFSSSCSKPHASSEVVDFEDEFIVEDLGYNTTYYSGEFSHWNFSMKLKEWIERDATFQNRTPKLHATVSAFDSIIHSPLNEELAIIRNFKDHHRARELQSLSSTIMATSSLPPRYIADFLIRAFFKYAQTNYFYVDRAWLLEKIELVYTNTTSLSKHDVSTVCIIFIVLAIGTQYAYLDQPSTDPRSQPLSQSSSTPFSEDEIGITFYQEACKMIPDVIALCSLESVQACLLIGVYTLPLDAPGLAYVYLNLAVKLAIQNGMHRKYAAADGAARALAAETRNRVWWTAYTIERRICIFHGRPLSISPDAVDADLPVQRPSLWSANSCPYDAHVLSTLRLHQILWKVSSEISNLTKPQYQSFAHTLNRLIKLKDALHTWREESQRLSSSDNNLDRSKLHIQLEYCLVLIFLGRRFILFPMSARSRNCSSSDEANTDGPATQESSAEARSVLVTECIEASFTAINTLLRLHSTVGLARASYTEFTACRAALLVIVAQCLQEKTERLHRALQDGMKMIRLMSTGGGESARLDASLLEGFERVVARLENMTTSSFSHAHEYAQFKNWESFCSSDDSMNRSAPTEQGLDMMNRSYSFLDAMFDDENLGVLDGFCGPSSLTEPWSFDTFSQNTEAIENLLQSDQCALDDGTRRIVGMDEPAPH